MGYTTNFTGAISLSRPLTIAEALEILEISEDSNLAKQRANLSSYMQWVPNETMTAIVWDRNEKFYGYTEALIWLCGWLLQRGISSDGQFQWSGEDADDKGILHVVDGVVFEIKSGALKPSNTTPLTKQKLANIALQRATQPQGFCPTGD